MKNCVMRIIKGDVHCDLVVPFQEKPKPHPVFDQILMDGATVYLGPQPESKNVVRGDEFHFHADSVFRKASK